MLALTRGGGEGVHELDDEALIAAVASSPVPVIVAAGHAADDLVVGRVADLPLPTPTALGAWFRQTLDHKWVQGWRTEETEAGRRAEELQARLERALRMQEWWPATAVILGLLVAATVALPLIKPWRAPLGSWVSQ